MDPHDIWQENKRWILGVLAGVLLFWVASTVIGGLYSPGAVARQVRLVQRSMEESAYYSNEALRAAREEASALAAVRERLDRALVFTPADEFVLEGKGDPDLHFDQVSRRVKRSVVERADALGVELVENDIDWPSPVGEEVQPTLFGLNLLEQAMDRLFEAHGRVRAANAEATGLAGVESFKVVGTSDRGRGGGASRRPRRGPAEAGDDLLREDNVRFRFRADEATVMLFLESCRAQEPPITLGPDFKMTVGRAPGEPLAVTGTLLALRLRTP